MGMAALMDIGAARGGGAFPGAPPNAAAGIAMAGAIAAKASGLCSETGVGPSCAGSERAPVSAGAERAAGGSGADGGALRVYRQSHPWVEDWLRSHDEFFVALAAATGAINPQAPLPDNRSRFPRRWPERPA